jgi:hypothetical protein
MDLGLAALVADHGNGSGVPALVGVALAGVGLAVMNLRGEKVDLCQVPRIVDPTANMLALSRCPPHRDFASSDASRPVNEMPSEERAVYRDWLMERPEQDLRDLGTLMSLRDADEPYVIVQSASARGTRVLCGNVRFEETSSQIVGPSDYRRNDVAELVRKAAEIAVGRAEAKKLLPPGDVFFCYWDEEIGPDHETPRVRLTEVWTTPKMLSVSVRPKSKANRSIRRKDDPFTGNVPHLGGRGRVSHGWPPLRVVISSDLGERIEPFPVGSWG